MTDRAALTVTDLRTLADLAREKASTLKADPNTNNLGRMLEIDARQFEWIADQVGQHGLQILDVILPEITRNAPADTVQASVISALQARRRAELRDA